MLLLKGPFDDLRREIEKVLGLPNGSTTPNSGFKWDLPSLPNFMKIVRAELESFVRRKY